MIKNFIFVVALLLSTVVYVRADGCTGYFLQGDIDQIPYSDGDSAIDIPHLIQVKVANRSTVNIQYVETHLSQGTYAAVLPFCGKLTVSLILDPVPDGQGGYVSGVSISNLPFVYPEIYGGYTWSLHGMPYTRAVDTGGGGSGGYSTAYLIGS